MPYWLPVDGRGLPSLVAQSLDHDPLVQPGRGADLDIVVASEATHSAVVGGQGSDSCGDTRGGEHQLGGGTWAACRGDRREGAWRRAGRVGGHAGRR